MTPEAPSAPPLRKRWLSFRLRTLLIVAPLIAIAAAWSFRLWYADYLEVRAAKEVERLGGEVVRNERHEIVSVQLAGRKIDDARLAELVPILQGLPKLRSLTLISNDISDAGVTELARLQQLETVYLAGTKVTPAGIVALNQQLPTLKVDMESPHLKATQLASRAIYKHATLSLAMTPSGQIVGGSGDGQVRVWDLQRGEMTRSFRAHTEWTFAVAFHPHRPWLATAGGDGLIKLWNGTTPEEIARFVGHDDDVHAIGFTPDGRTLVSAGDDMTLRVWDVATRQVRHVLAGHSGTIPGLAISPDGATAASASRDGTIRLWNIASGESLGVLEGHRDDVLAVDFHPSGKSLASASYDRSVILWDLVTRQPSRVLSGHKDWVFSVAWSPDGKQLASTAGDGVRLWNSNEGQLRWHSEQQKNVSHVLWLGNQWLATSSADSSVMLQNAASGTAIVTLWPQLVPRLAKF